MREIFSYISHVNSMKRCYARAELDESETCQNTNGVKYENRRFRLIGIAGVIVVVLVAGGIAYASHFASTTTQTQAHKAAGPIIVPTATATTASSATSTTASRLRTFTIVPAQTTASYSVYENLILQNKPNNDAIGTTHSVQGSFKVQTGSSQASRG